MFKYIIKEHLSKVFERFTRKLDSGHRFGLRLLARQALGYRLLIVGSILANVLAALFEGGTMGILATAVSVLVQSDSSDVAAKPGLVETYIEEFVGQVDTGGIFLILVLAAVGAQICKSALAYLGDYFSIKLRFIINRKLQEQVTRQAMRLSYSQIGQYPAGTISATISQVDSVTQLIVWANKILLTLILFVTYVLVMLLMSVPLTLAAIGVIVVFGFSLSGLIRKIRDLGRKMVVAAMRVGKTTFEYLQAPRLLRLFNATDIAERTINYYRADMLEAKKKSDLIMAGISPATDAITITGAGAFLIVGYLLAGSNVESVLPGLLVFVVVLNRMMPQVKEFNKARMGIFRSVPSLKIVADFLNEKDKKFARRGGVRFPGLVDEIRFDNVSFRYSDTEVDAVSEVNFTISKGKTVALVGSSGAGKSTLSDLLLGLHDPTEGRITVDGVNLKDINLKDWRANIGVVDQEFLLLNTSVLNNISFSKEQFNMADVEKAAQAAHATEFINSLPEKYHTEIGDRGHKLSGGQQQRLALARALLMNPQILVLDEATSALDTKSERKILTTLEELRRERTMLIIAHRLSTLVQADTIIVLEKGQIVEQGTWKELMNRNGIFSTMWSSQTGGRIASVFAE